MNLLFILSLILELGLVTACPPPFNKAAFINVNDTATAIQQYMLEHNLGWADGVSNINNPHKRWPRSEEHGEYTVIRYCYETPTDYSEFKDLLESSWKLWSDVIGPAGASSGHSLKFEEIQWDNGAAWKYCKKPQSNTDLSLVWNPDVPGDTVVIKKSTTSSISYATLGYTYSSWDDTKGRHTIAIWKDLANRSGDNDAVRTVAHEIGHVLGLWHEHQRPDRDHYVYFNCKNLRGYDTVKAAVEKEGKYPMDQVCNDANLGYAYGFISPQFSKETYRDPEGFRWNVENGKKYDLFSIMHYSSLSGAANPGASATEVFPLTLYPQGKPNYVPPKDPKFPQIIVKRPNMKPSQEDKNGVLSLYSWKPT